MKASKFLKDLLYTGFSQGIVLLCGVLLIKLMTAALSQEYFGLFTLVRRWVAILLPIVTLNLSIGLTRFVSFEEENSGFYLHVSLLAFVILTSVVSMVFVLVPGVFAELFFKSPESATFVYVLVFFLAANFMNMLTYAYFRGKLYMKAANSVRTLFFGFPLLLGLLMLLKKNHHQAAALNLFFILYSLVGVLISLFYLRKEISLTAFKNLLKARCKTTFNKSRHFFTFSLSRIPGVLFNSLLLSLPAVIAAHKISLTAAGYMGIVLAVLRLLEIFSMPFNMIFLPKFSSLLRDNQLDNIKHYTLAVLDFIFTFLPITAIIIFGLSRYIILAWVGSGYLPVVDSVAVIILFSVFYLAFALVRGILDGLYTYPFNNFINLAGLLILVPLSFTIGSDVFRLSLAFGCGLLTVGLVSIGVLVKKLTLPLPWLTILKATAINIILFLTLRYLDGMLMKFQLKPLHSVVVYVSYRIPLVLMAWFFYWRKTVWYREVLKRIDFKGSRKGDRR
jgi:O-antigen/teichoic acid export membrane protein